MKNVNELEFIWYSGFGEPELLAVGFNELKETLTVESNYLGDVTDDTLEGLSDIIEMFDTVEDAQKYGENVFNDIWINPTLENLQEVNVHSYGLCKNDYLENY